ncbi:MAG: glycoside hydrolase family 65 protein [Candidatus Eisenbacteria bacterium]|nr:glycoside hydrolase family 65 protein [Candidatus Eisenbacteria bacterium]
MNHQGWTTTDWKLIYESWNPQQQPLREALCTLGNGYFATRGAAEEASAGGPHYPGTYLGSGYNRLESEVKGRVIENEDLVNWPNWLSLTFRPEDGDWLDLDAVDILEFRQELDVHDGVLMRKVRFRDRQGRVTRLTSRRLVHMTDPYLAGIQWELVPEDWSGKIQIRSTLDGSVTNSGVARYRDLAGRHLQCTAMDGVAEEGICLAVETVQSKIRMAQAARTRVYLEDKRASCERRTIKDGDRITHEIDTEVEALKRLRVEKIVAVHTSRDPAISECGLAARQRARRAPEFDQLLASHTRTWHHYWNRSDLHLEDCDEESQFILRFHIFHLLQTVSLNSVDRDVGVPPRGLHGEAYRGHIFWDEVFIFPFLNLRLSTLTRELLLYRYRRLDEARHAARRAGYRGAMFPWQSGSSGREESQRVHLNPRSGRWVQDETHLQRHINSAIAYNVWQYYQATADTDFLAAYGAELIASIARFWSSIAVWNPDRDRYEIRGVVGPDEFHTRYPEREEPGVDNNAYTNFMAAWTLCCACEMMSAISRERRRELLEKLEITDDELAHWELVSRKMFIPFHDDGVLSQFEGYEKLKEFPWEEYKRKYDDLQRLDRILEAEGDSPNNYKVSKQADVLMLFFLFSADELRAVFKRLDYPFPGDLIPQNVEYYLARTSHGSTLSRLVHAWVLARSNRERSWSLFLESLRSDLVDIQGGTTPEGIHLGAMAGTVDLLQRCYAGIETRRNVLRIDPQLPDELRALKFRLRYRGHHLTVRVEQTKAAVSFDRGPDGPVDVVFGDKKFTISEGETHTFDL